MLVAEPMLKIDNTQIAQRESSHVNLRIDQQKYRVELDWHLLCCYGWKKPLIRSRQQYRIKDHGSLPYASLPLHRLRFRHKCIQPLQMGRPDDLHILVQGDCICHRLCRKKDCFPVFLA